MILSSSFRPKDPASLDAFLRKFDLEKVEPVQDGQALVRFVADDTRRRLPGHIYNQGTRDYEVVSVEDFAQELAPLLEVGSVVEVRDVGYEYLEQNVYGRVIVVRWDGKMKELDLDDAEEQARQEWGGLDCMSLP